MNITASMVKELREKTGVGMMDCKKALVETNGDMEAAVEYLRKKGMATAAKKAGRIAAEGLTAVIVTEDEKTGAIVEVNSETDFVAKNEVFRNYVNDVAKQALASETDDMDAFMASAWLPDTASTVKDALVAKVAVIGENLQIRRFQKMVSPSYIGTYVHGGGRISVLVNIESEIVNDKVKEAAHFLAMQVAAMNPRYNTRADIPAEYLQHERTILADQIAQDPKMAGKPEKVVAGIVEGRLSKQLKEVVLADQDYQFGGETVMTVSQFLQQVSKEVGCPVKVLSFVRFETGEGIEKKKEDFAAEVAKQMGE